MMRTLELHRLIRAHHTHQNRQWNCANIWAEHYDCINETVSFNVVKLDYGAIWSYEDVRYLSWTISGPYAHVLGYLASASGAKFISMQTDNGKICLFSAQVRILIVNLFFLCVHSLAFELNSKWTCAQLYTSAYARKNLPIQHKTDTHSPWRREEEENSLNRVICACACAQPQVRIHYKKISMQLTK